MSRSHINIKSSVTDSLKSPLRSGRRTPITISQITQTGPRSMVSLIMCPFTVRFCTRYIVCVIIWWKRSFVSPAQEQSNVYPSQSYSTSFSAQTTSVAPSAQEDLGGPRKNGDAHKQEHVAINFTTATTSDTITIHTGKGNLKPSDFFPSGTQVKLEVTLIHHRKATPFFKTLVYRCTSSFFQLFLYVFFI